MAIALQEIYTPESIHTYTRPQEHEFAPSADYDHAQVVFFVNRAVEKTLDEHKKISERPFPQYAVEEGKRLISGITTARQEVQEMEQTKAADELRAKYTLADIDSLGLSTKERVMQRIKAVGTEDRATISDIDGTMTLDPENYLERLIPASSVGERLLKEHGGNRKIFPYAFAMTWQHGLKTVPHAYREAGRQVALRPGIKEYIAYEMDKGHVFKANSANFTDFGLGVLDQIPQAEGAQLHAVNVDDLTAIDKGTNIKRDAITTPSRPTFFVGDGGSDEAALEAREYVTCYFALKGGGFEKQLKEARLASGEPVPYFSYETYHDILGYMQEFDAVNTFEEQTAN